MLTIRIDEKRVYIAGGAEFAFSVSPNNELVVEAPEGVRFAVGGRHVRPACTERTAEPIDRQSQERFPEVVDSSLPDLKAPGLESFAYLRAVLQRHQRPMSTAEITKRVLAETAYQTEAVDPQNTLRTALGRKPELFTREKVGGKSIWGLTEWLQGDR